MPVRGIREFTTNTMCLLKTRQRTVCEERLEPRSLAVLSMAKISRRVPEPVYCLGLTPLMLWRLWHQRLVCTVPLVRLYALHVSLASVNSSSAESGLAGTPQLAVSLCGSLQSLWIRGVRLWGTRQNTAHPIIEQQSPCTLVAQRGLEGFRSEEQISGFCHFVSSAQGILIWKCTLAPLPTVTELSL